MSHAELIERLRGLQTTCPTLHATFSDAATAIAALVAERDALAAEVEKLSKPDWFYSADDPEYSYGDPEDAADDMGHDGITPLIGAREVWKKWAAVRCVALDANGDVDETKVMLFETEAEALRCWPESLAIARAALAQGGEKP